MKSFSKMFSTFRIIYQKIRVIIFKVREKILPKKVCNEMQTYLVLNSLDQRA